MRHQARLATNDRELNGIAATGYFFGLVQPKRNEVGRLALFDETASPAGIERSNYTLGHEIGVRGNEAVIKTAITNEGIVCSIFIP